MVEVFWSHNDIATFYDECFVSRHSLVCLRLLVCGYGSPYGAVVVLRYDPRFDIKVLFFIYICGGTSDVKVFDRLVCIGAFDDKVLCFCEWVY